METIYLTVPGVTNSSANHWQSFWEKEFPEKFRRIEQAEWNTPICADRVETNLAQVNSLLKLLLVKFKRLKIYRRWHNRVPTLQVKN